jgi:hypothetical protein
MAKHQVSIENREYKNTRFKEKLTVTGYEYPNSKNPNRCHHPPKRVRVDFLSPSPHHRSQMTCDLQNSMVRTSVSLQIPLARSRSARRRRRLHPQYHEHTAALNVRQHCDCDFERCEGRGVAEMIVSISGETERSGAGGDGGDCVLVELLRLGRKSDLFGWEAWV